MTFALVGIAFAGGYAASVFTWDKVKVWVVGVETQVRALEGKIKALKAKL